MDDRFIEYNKQTEVPLKAYESALWHLNVILNNQ